MLALGATGHRRAASIHDREASLDFFDLKGDLEQLLSLFDLSPPTFEPDGCRQYEPGLRGRFTEAGVTLALFGRLSRELERDYKLRQPAWIAEVDFERLLTCPLKSRTYRAFSKFPAVERDFSLTVPDTLAYARLEAVLRNLRREEIQGFRPVDLFRGGAIPANHYSLLLRFTFQSPTRTLTSEDIAEASRQVLQALEPLGVRLRT